jgi:hypothetical protein
MVLAMRSALSGSVGASALIRETSADDWSSGSVMVLAMCSV